MRDCPAGQNLGVCFRFSAFPRSEMVSENVENLTYEAGNVKKKSPAARAQVGWLNVGSVARNVRKLIKIHISGDFPFYPPG